MRKLTMRERVLLAILVVVAVVSGYVLLFSMPLSQKMETLEGEIAQEEELNTQLENRWAQQQRLQQLTEQLKNQEGDIRYMPEYDNLQAVMVELNTILADCEEYSLAFQEDGEEDAIFARRATIPFTCGSYEQARTILQRLHDSSLRNLLTDVQIAEQEDGSVKVTADMIFFEYRTDFQPEEKEESPQD